LLLNRPLARRRLRTFPDLNLRVVDVRQHLARGARIRVYSSMAFALRGEAFFALDFYSLFPRDDLKKAITLGGNIASGIRMNR
jgi:hypothetical protein